MGIRLGLRDETPPLDDRPDDVEAAHHDREETEHALIVGELEPDRFATAPRRVAATERVLRDEAKAEQETDHEIRHGDRKREHPQQRADGEQAQEAHTTKKLIDAPEEH